jgi:hypothetical protein
VVALSAQVTDSLADVAVGHQLQEENVERMFFLMMNSSALEGLIDCNTMKYGN